MNPWVPHLGSRQPCLREAPELGESIPAWFPHRSCHRKGRRLCRVCWLCGAAHSQQTRQMIAGMTGSLPVMPAIITNTPVPASVHAAGAAFYKTQHQPYIQTQTRLLFLLIPSSIMRYIDASTCQQHKRLFVSSVVPSVCEKLLTIPNTARHNDDVRTRSLIPSSASLLLLSRVSL